MVGGWGLLAGGFLENLTPPRSVVPLWAVPKTNFLGLSLSAGNGAGGGGGVGGQGIKHPLVIHWPPPCSPVNFFIMPLREKNAY